MMQHWTLGGLPISFWYAMFTPNQNKRLILLLYMVTTTGIEPTTFALRIGTRP